MSKAIYDKLFDGVENVTTMTLAQYNALVKGEDILEPIPDWDPNQPINEVHMRTPCNRLLYMAGRSYDK